MLYIVFILMMLYDRLSVVVSSDVIRDFIIITDDTDFGVSDCYIHVVNVHDTIINLCYIMFLYL